MKNLIVGNGINIQFGGTDNTNKSIIIRAIRNCKQLEFPKHIIVDDPDLMLTMIGHLFLEVQSLLKDGYDKYALSSVEKEGLEEFRNRYKRFPNLKLTDIGFEDYYLIYDLFCHRHKITSSEKVIIKDAIRAFFLHSIYNKGKINEIHNNYPAKLLDFFNTFDCIFTTNYDKNIEISCNKNLFYLHGAFHIKKDEYNPESIRNKLLNKNKKDYQIDENYYYLYSNALTDYSGDLKSFSITQSGYANSSIEKMVKGYIENESIRKDIDSWQNDSNQILQNMYESIKLKIRYPDLKFNETYPIKQFQEIKGSVEILGLSPFNDNHIFKGINENTKIENVIYYFYDLKEQVLVEKLLKNFNVIFVNVMDFWRDNIMKKNISKTDFHKFAEIFRSCTGSTMKDDDILNGYNSIDKKRRMQLFDRINQIVQERNIPFDKALPLITVELNVLAAEEETDPAILLMLYIDNLKQK